MGLESSKIGQDPSTIDTKIPQIRVCVLYSNKEAFNYKVRGHVL